MKYKTLINDGYANLRGGAYDYFSMSCRSSARSTDWRETIINSFLTVRVVLLPNNYELPTSNES